MEENKAVVQQTAAKNSLGVAGFICSILVPPVGFVLSIIALLTGKGKKKGLAIAGVIIGAIFSIIGFASCAAVGKAVDEALDSTPSVVVESKGNVSSSATKAGVKSQASYQVGEAKAVLFSDSIGSNWIQIMVPVTNDGETNLYFSSGSVDLEDENGHLVDSKSYIGAYPEVLMPGETAWYYEETILEDKYDTLKLIPHVDVKEAKVDCIRYLISDVSIKDEEYGDIKITGRVENNTDEDGTFVYVVFMLYDSSNNFLGRVFTILDNDLTAGDKVGFSASSLSMPRKIKAADIDHYEAYAYPTQYQW